MKESIKHTKKHANQLQCTDISDSTYFPNEFPKEFPNEFPKDCSGGVARLRSWF